MTLRPALFLLPAALALSLAACSEDPETLDGSTPGADASGLDGAPSSGSDGAAGGDSGPTTDGAASGADAQSFPDAFTIPEDGSVARRDASTPGDEAGTSAVCAELAACCPTLPFGAMQCMQTADSGAEENCQRALDLLTRLNQCMGTMSGDAGPRPDAEPLGPLCMELLACCPETQNPQICEAVTRLGEMRCDQALMRYHGDGICLGDGGVADGGVTPDAAADAGTSANPDATPAPDAPPGDAGIIEDAAATD